MNRRWSLSTMLLTTLGVVPLLAHAAAPVQRAVVVADRNDPASEAAVAHARARIKADTPLVDNPTDQPGAAARQRGMISCAGASACMAKVLRDTDAKLALFLRVDGKMLTVQQVVVDGDETTDALTQVAVGPGGVLAALDRHLDEHVIVPLGHPDAAARARARLGVIPPTASPVASPEPVQPKTIPQSPLAPPVNRAQPRPQCYGARTDDCPDGF